MTVPTPDGHNEGAPPLGGNAPTLEDGSDGGSPREIGGFPPKQADRPPPGEIGEPPPKQADGGPPGRTSGPPPGQTSGPPPRQADDPPTGQTGPPPPRGRQKPLIIGLAFASLVAYSIVNAILGILIFISTLDQNGPNHPIIISCTIFLALLGLGAGAGLQFLRKPWATGLGLGFLIGWALWSILSAGICTGISPDLYT
ncbi:hypothetical protein [Nonomuraea sp. NEAU-A123]|uniref:hypothetical protein n=1 Tax=Nonomuraea sp. NEAU-A123 TaxID=2839649 RepID=UPI001BE3D982|nr:hypothetical protein [Nonomuraea sp. NEAU-A123]MBT2226060.1 hypothetical protein [Nonomuraea sp. NEAU-A123]